MKISVRESSGRGFTIPLPNAMLFSPTLLRFGLNFSRKHAGATMPDIPPETLKALCNAFKQVKQKYGVWELIHVESGGNTVSITI